MKRLATAAAAASLAFLILIPDVAGAVVTPTYYTNGSTSWETTPSTGPFGYCNEDLEPGGQNGANTMQAYLTCSMVVKVSNEPTAIMPYVVQPLTSGTLQMVNTSVNTMPYATYNSGTCGTGKAYYVGTITGSSAYQWICSTPSAYNSCNYQPWPSASWTQQWACIIVNAYQLGTPFTYSGTSWAALAIKESITWGTYPFTSTAAVQWPGTTQGGAAWLNQDGHWNCSSGNLTSPATNTATTYSGNAVGSGGQPYTVYMASLTCGLTGFPTMPTQQATGFIATPPDPCAITAITGPMDNGTNGAHFDGTPAEYQITFSGPHDGAILTPYNLGYGLSTVASLNGYTGVPPGTGYNNESVNITSSASKLDFTVKTQKGADAGGTLDCYYQGTIYETSLYGDSLGLGVIQPITSVSTSGGTFDLAGCTNEAYQSLSLTDPGSWVNYGLTGIACVAQWAFIPSSTAYDSLTTNFNTHIPLSWVTDLGNAVGTINTGLSNGIASGPCDAPSVTPFSGVPHGSHDLMGHLGSSFSTWTINFPSPASAGCSGPGSSSAGELFGFRGLIRTTETLSLYAATGLAVWEMMPWNGGAATFRRLANDNTNNSPQVDSPE